VGRRTLLLRQVNSYNVIRYYQPLRHPEWDFKALPDPLLGEADAAGKARRAEFDGRGGILPLSFFITDDLFIVGKGGLSKNSNP